MSKVLHWNGKDLPDGLREAPVGRYVLLPVDEAPALTPEQESGLEAAMNSLDGEEGVPLELARERLANRLK